MLLKTPLYDLRNYPEVYEPSEDSFLFLDALEQELQALKSVNPVFAVEIGSGSGIVITALASIVGNTCTYFATDINKDACEATLKTANLNEANINCINMDLLTNFRKHLFDIILFNPPYVVTETDEIIGRGLNRAWAGGAQGREITDRILHNLHNFLSKSGVCYMLLLKENNLGEIKTLLNEYNLKTNILIDRKIRGEHLYMVKIQNNV